MAPAGRALRARLLRARRLHPWRVSYEQALVIQRRLRERLRVEPLKRPARLVAGADVAYSRPTHRMYASVVVIELPSLGVVAHAHALRRARFPYIPGLFSFREVPPLLAAFERLKVTPDVIMFDGQGLAHPRRLGLACHAGLLFDTPSLGCAKSLLVGRHGPLALERGATAQLIHDGELVGAAVRTRAAVKPVYVSVGHRIELQQAIELVLATAAGFRLPEPVRLAHLHTAARMRRFDGRVRPAVRHDYPDLLK
jgi:deoxyribonuclease V